MRSQEGQALLPSTNEGDNDRLPPFLTAAYICRVRATIVPFHQFQSVVL
jgi:hypothetical protein